jgi:hypothetical protein
MMQHMPSVARILKAVATRDLISVHVYMTKSIAVPLSLHLSMHAMLALDSRTMHVTSQSSQAAQASTQQHEHFSTVPLGETTTPL